MPRSRPHVSTNRLEGSLCDVPFSKLADECRRHLITGTIRVEVDGKSGVAELRAGVVDHAEFDSLKDDQAVAHMRELRDGLYQLTQRLPDLTGALGESAECQGDLTEVPLATIMRHCEDQALSCTITVVSEFERGEIRYRAGDIVEVTMNGARDEDAIVDIVRFQRGRFRVSAAPLALDIDGWPSVSADPTEPFRIEHLAAARPRAAAPEAPPAVASGTGRREAMPEPEPAPEPDALPPPPALTSSPATDAGAQAPGIAIFVLLGAAMLLLSALVWTIAVKL
jgi:hypothetical protein